MENNKREFINSIIYLLQQNEELLLSNENNNSQNIQLLKNKVNIIDFYTYEQDNPHIPVTLQEKLLNNLNEILNINNELTRQEKDDFWHFTKKLTDNIDQNVIINSDLINNNVKTFLLYLKNDKKTLISRNNIDTILKIGNFEVDTLNEHVLKILDINTASNKLLVHGLFVSKFVNENIRIQLIVETNDDRQILDCENIYDKKNSIIINTIYNYNEFKVEVPINNKEKSRLSFEVILNNKIIYIPVISLDNYNHKSKIVYPYYISIGEKFLNIERGYKFSLIMALYNSEYYLHQALDSIVNQDMSFEDDVQLILINDGSTDKSKDICLEYQKRYPENIVYIEQKNSGQATARNNGLKHIRGKYVNFIDSDDYFETNALREVYSFFEKNNSKTDVVSIPIKFFERQNRYHNLHNKFKKSRVVDLLKEPNNPQLSAPSSFIKSEMLEKTEFPTNVMLSEDTILLNKIILEKKTIGLLNTTHYNYRKRFNNSSTIDSTSKNDSVILTQFKNYFMELINYSLKKEGEVIPYIQYLIAYDLQWFLKEPELNITSENEKNEFKTLLNKILSYIDKKCIKNNQYVTYNIFISFYMYLKDGGLKEIVEENNIILKTKNHQIDSLKDHNIWIDIIEIKNGMLNISGFINSHFDDDKLSIYAEKEYDNKIEKFHAKTIKYTSRKDINYLSKVWQFKNSFDIKIPLSNHESNIRIRIDYLVVDNEDNNQDKNVLPFYLNIKFTKYAKISEISNYIVKDDYILTFIDNTFVIEKYSFKKLRVYEEIVQNRIMNKKSYNYVESLNLRKKYVNYYPFIRLFKKFFKIYIFSDRIDHADDNSEHLFRYANKRMDNVIKYFAVSKDSKDYERISKIGKVLDFHSKKHKWMYLLADKVISTHPYESNTNPFFSYDKNTDERENNCGLITSDIYFLQHGVTKDDISDWMSKYDKNLSLLVTVNDQEKESFYNEGYGFDPGIIQTLGFPRYDNLKNNNNKQILIIPTWRKSLRGNKNIFLKSEYYNLLNDLLNNQELIDLAKENGYKIIFKAHPELEKNINDTDERYIDLFDINDYIKLSTQESYQELFNSSSLLITDYSSVFFDFAYEKKPVIYYQPTENHYQKGYFDYESMGFGEIVRDRNTLLETIEEYINSNCKMKDRYAERVSNFFKYTDKNNSKRVYEWIKKH